MSTVAEVLETPVCADAADVDVGDVALVQHTDRSSGFFYGWLMLPLAVLLMVASCPGQTFGITFFNAKFRETFALTQTGLSATYLIATVLASFFLPYLGSLTDRFGLKRSVLVVAAAMAGVCLMISQCQGVGILFVSFMLFRIFGAGALVLLANNTLAVWFDRRLGLASGIMQVSMACAMAVVPAGIVWLIEVFGWRGAYLAMAAIFTCGLLPVMALAYRESPGLIGQFPDGIRPTDEEESRSLQAIGLTNREATRHRAYWILLAATATWALVGTGLMFHLEALFASRGLEQAATKWAITCTAIGMASAQIVGGCLADRIAVRWLLAAAVGLIATSCTLMAALESHLLPTCFAVYGVGQGMMSIVAGTAWARYFGRVQLGKIRGTSLTAAIGGSSLGPLLMGISADYLDGFEPALWLFTGVAALVSLASFWATPPQKNDEVANDE